MILVAKQREASQVYSLIDEIDPNAFVTQTAVSGVYGNGFDKFKVKRNKKRAEELAKAVSAANANAQNASANE